MGSRKLSRETRSPSRPKAVVALCISNHSLRADPVVGPLVGPQSWRLHAEASGSAPLNFFSAISISPTSLWLSVYTYSDWSANCDPVQAKAELTCSGKPAGRLDISVRGPGIANSCGAARVVPMTGPAPEYAICEDVNGKYLHSPVGIPVSIQYQGIWLVSPHRQVSAHCVVYLLTRQLCHSLTRSLTVYVQGGLATARGGRKAHLMSAFRWDDGKM